VVSVAAAAMQAAAAAASVGSCTQRPAFIERREAE